MEIIKHIKKQFKKVSDARQEAIGRVKLLNEQKTEIEKSLEESKNGYKVQEEVLDVLRTYSSLKEQVLREKVDKVVTKGLRIIFGERYKSKMEFGISRGQAVINPKVVSEVDGEELITSVEGARGGGLVNVVSVLYQVLVLSLVRPKQRQVLFLDEPFRNLSECYLETTGNFLRQLCEKVDMQIVLITHRPVLTEMADRKYMFTLQRGVTEVEAE